MRLKIIEILIDLEMIISCEKFNEIIYDMVYNI